MTMKQCSTSLVFMAMKIKIIRHQYHTLQIGNNYESDNTKCWESRAIERSYIVVGGSINWNNFEKYLAIINLNMCILCNPAIPFLRILEKHLRTSKRKTGTRALTTKLYNSKKLKSIRMPIKIRMNKLQCNHIMEYSTTMRSNELYG